MADTYTRQSNGIHWSNNLTSNKQTMVEDTLKVAVTTKHFRNATRYLDPTGCPLREALLDTYGSFRAVGVHLVSVLVFTTDGYTLRYKIPGANATFGTGNTRWTSDEGQGYSETMIDNLIKEGRDGIDVPTINLTLVLDREQSTIKS